MKRKWDEKTHAERNKYLKNPNFLIVKKLGFEKLAKSQHCIRKSLVPLKQVEIDKLSGMRFMPKPNGLRPIILVKKGDLTSIEIKKCKLLLNELSKKYKLCSDMETEWANICCHSKNKPIYFVKTDFKDAYGSIRHQKLLKLLKDDLKQSPKIFKFRQYRALKESPNLSNKPKYRYIHLDENGYPTENLRERNRIYLQSGEDLLITCVMVYNLISRFLKTQVIQFDKKTRILLQCGIAQGAVLSAAICEYYLSALCHSYLQSFIGEDSKLFRYVDDLLFVSTSKKKAKTFLKKIEKGFINYNLKISAEKTLHNLNDKPIRFSYRGITICSSSFQPLISVSSIPGLDQRYIFSIIQHRNLNEYFAKRLTSISRNEFQSFLVNPKYASHASIVANIWRLGISIAAKLESIMFYINERKLFFDCKLFSEMFNKIGFQLWRKIKHVWTSDNNCELKHSSETVKVALVGGVLSIIGKSQSINCGELKYKLKKLYKCNLHQIPDEIKHVYFYL